MPHISDPIRCTITDISSLGAFVEPDRQQTVPENFDLTIGDSTLPRSCRIARSEHNGFGVKFLDPVRHEVEEILTGNAFQEELLLEPLSLSQLEGVTITKIRLDRTTDAIMDLIERRSTITWPPTDASEQFLPRRISTR